MDERDFNSTMTPNEAERLRKPRAHNNSPAFPRLSIKGGEPAPIATDEDALDEDGRGGIDPPEQTEVFQQVVAIIRWGVLGLLIILAAARIVEGQDQVLSTLLLGFFGLTITRHARPIRFDKGLRCDLAILLEVILSVVSIALTGL